MNLSKNNLPACILGLLFVANFGLSAQTLTEKAATKDQGKKVPAAAQALVERSGFKARGKNETIVHIPLAGRYSIQVKSSQGTAVELVDRMAGQIGAAGTAGEKDGRLDIVLDRGDYKVRLLSHAKGDGDVNLKVLPFREVKPVNDPADHPLLKELALEKVRLADLEQQSFWIELKERRVLNIEIQGRALAECRLWKDGVLWEDLQPTMTVYEPEAGKPMTHIEFHHDLNPGLYLLSCYGGPLQKWSEDKGETPLYLRWGVPYIGENGQHLFTLSPFGRDVFMVGKSSNFFQLVRKDKKNTQLTVRRWPQTDPRFGGGSSAAIGKESRDPWCKVAVSLSGDFPQIAIVTGAPGDALELDYFKQVYWYEINNLNAHYWLSSIHSAEGRDALDVTAILFNYLQKTALQQQVQAVGPNKPLLRRVNLLARDNIYIFVEREGTYVIDEDEASGAASDYQITPFMIFRNSDYREPPFLEAGQEWVLTAGYHVLTLRPKSLGIIHFALRQKSGLLGSIKKFISGDTDSLSDKSGTPELGFCWPDVTFSLNTSYLLAINNRANVESGIIMRCLPLDLQESLPVTLKAGASVPLPVKIDKDSTLEVSGGDAQMSSAGVALAEHALLPAGNYQLELKNTTQKTVLYNVRIVPVPATPARPLVKKIETVLPTLVENNVHYADYDRSQTREFLLRVEKPAFYRLETTGLLATSIKVRSFLVASLFAAQENGIGRNALVQQYLKPGDYVVAVSTLGQTMGRAGLRLRRTPLEFSDELAIGNVSRKRVAADAALCYHFNIPQKGIYRLETMGLGKTFSYRLEEEGGWPLILNGKNQYIQQEFSAGDYYYYTLPEAVAGRRVSTIRPIIEEKLIRGKGPHALALNRPLANIWMETSERKPDVYDIEITAPIHARLTVEKDFEAVLLDRAKSEKARSKNGEWQGDLVAGAYSILVTSSERNNRLPYTIFLGTEDLVPGMSQTVSSLPTTLELSLGEPGLVEIASLDRQDCRAVLFDKNSGSMIAEADDMPADWNFLLARELPAGRYQLRIEPMTPHTLPFEVSMSMRRARTLAEHEVPFSLHEKIGKDILKVPFRAGTSEQLLHFFLQKNAAMQMALLKDGKIIAEDPSEIFIPLASGGRYALMIWQQGDQSGEVKLQTDVLPTPRLNVERETILDAFQAARIANPNGYGLQAEATSQAVLFSPAVEQPCAPQGNPNEKVLVGPGWLALGQPGRLQLAPLTLMPDKEENLSLGGSPLPFAVADNGQPMLLECESADAMVSARIDPLPSGGSEIFPWAGSVMNKALTLTGIPDSGSFRGEIRNLAADPKAFAPASNLQAERVTLRLRSFPLQQSLEIPASGTLTTELQPGRSMKLAVKNDSEILKLLLPQDVVAFSWSNGRAVAMTAALDGSHEECLLAKPGFLYIVNRGQTAAPLLLSRMGRKAAAEFIFDPGQGLEKIFAANGQLRLLIDDIPTGHYLCLAGENVASYFLDRSGLMIAGRAMPGLETVSGYRAGGGWLVIDHGVGLIKVWIAPEQSMEESFIGNLKMAEISAWQGEKGILKNNLQKWDIALPDFCLLTAGITSPGALGLFAGNKPLAIRAGVDPGSNWFFVMLEPGDYSLYTRPLLGHFQEGQVFLQLVKPQALMSAKTEKDMLIGAGDMQVFRFTVKSTGKVGVGLISESDGLDAWLCNREMTVLQKGTLIIRDLDAGEYFLVVAAAAPARFRPVVLGSEGSLQQIPDDIMREYLGNGGTNEN
jgi:hypothetical protein